MQSARRNLETVDVVIKSRAAEESPFTSLADIQSLRMPQKTQGDKELMWIRVEGCLLPIIVGALYHPPKYNYREVGLLVH